MKVRLVTGPTIEPVTLAEMKTHLRVDHTDDDTYITSLQAMARREIERLYGLSMISQTWEIVLDTWPSVDYPREWRQTLNSPPSSLQAIWITNPPLLSVTSITYTDPQGVSQVFPSNQYRALLGIPGRIVPVYGAYWPAVRSELESIVVRYVSGYSADTSLVPETLKHAIKLMVGTAYDQGAEAITGTIVGRIGIVDRLIASEFSGTYW
jgi:uncharacterized phiE125 gp8 family phage protein